MVQVPAGYVEAFRSDFSNTSVVPVNKWGSWSYELRGGEFGYNWQSIGGFAAGGLWIQTLAPGKITDIENYQKASIVDFGGKTKVLKFESKKDLSGDTALQRVQLVGGFDSARIFNKQFFEFDVYYPLSIKECVKGAWLDFIEWHECGDNCRLSVYMEGNATTGVVKMNASYKDDNIPGNQKIWSRNLGVFDKWDQWVRVSVQVEAGNPNGGVLRIWMNGTPILDASDLRIDAPIHNIHPLKLYMRGAKLGPGAVCYCDNFSLYRGV